MKKVLGLLSTGLVALALVSPAGAAPTQQKVEGTIVLPAPYTDDSGCFAGVHRRINAVAMGNHNGVIGYNFEVDKATWNKPFKLDVSGGQGSHIDMDITYYLGPLTTLEDIIAAGGDAPPPASVSFAERQPGGEKGIVPKMAENVIICMYGGGQGAGFAADFVYTAGKGVK